VRKLGTALHTTVSGQLIVRGTTTIAISTPVYTKKNQLIGFVKDVFGPVSYPYFSIVLKKPKEGQSLVGTELYYTNKNPKYHRKSSKT
jgi:RNA-binding protein